MYDEIAKLRVIDFRLRAKLRTAQKIDSVIYGMTANSRILADTELLAFAIGAAQCANCIADAWENIT